MPEAGVVYLVGAGPGDPGLITVRGLNVLRTADVVLHDRLVPESLLAEARSDATMINVGKTPGEANLSQWEINELLVDHCRSGKTVCRLKGGDPFVFGRGGEEAMALAAAGLKWEVVPGVTSAIAAPAYAGIPVTHRGVSSGVAVVTGSEDPDGPGNRVDWDAAAAFDGTLVVLMGWRNLPDIVDALTSRGVPAERPAAAIKWGTKNTQRVAAGTLANIADLAISCGLGPPMALVVGEVAALRNELAWFDKRPLFGKRVLVTRARSQASRLAESLEAHGAETIQAPAIRICPVADTKELDTAIRNISEYDWITFTSPNGVRGLRDRLAALSLDSRALFGVRVATVGPATAKAVEEMGIRPDLSPRVYAAERLVDEFASAGVQRGRALCLRSDIGRETLPDGLRKAGLEVDEVVAYRTEMAPDSSEAAREALCDGARSVDATTFTSSSTVTNLARLLGGDVEPINHTVVACIGPVTAETAREQGIRVDVVAKRQTVDGLVESLIDHFESGRGE